MVIRLLALFLVVTLSAVGAQVVSAETPTPISIFIEEKITVGEGNNSQIPTSKVFEEPISVTNKIIIEGPDISASPSKRKTKISAIPTSTTVPRKIIPKEIKKSATAVPSKRQAGTGSKNVDKKPSIKSTVTPISVSSREDRRSPFSRGTGSVNEEEPAESGSCNSVSGYEGLALMSVLLIPGVLKYRRRKK